MFNLTQRAKNLWATYRLEVVYVGLFLVAMLAAFSYLLTPADWKLRSLLLSISTGSIGGGVFAFLTKTAQLGGVIREELEKVVYSQEHLSARTDRHRLWLNATRSLFGDRFPALQGKLTDQALKGVLPSEKRFYVKDARRRIAVALIDDTRGLVEIQNDFQAILCTESGTSKVLRRTEWWYNPSAIPDGDLEMQIEAQRSTYCRSINGPFEPELTDTPSKPEPFGESLMRVTFEAELKPGCDYVVREKGIERQYLSVDNTCIHVAATYIDGLEVIVDHGKGLSLQFHTIGGCDFRDVYPRSGSIHKKTEDVLFSDAGFLITIQRVT
jgi:hypothetical protein